MTKEVCPEDVKDTELKLYYKEMPNLRVGKDGILRHRSTENPSGAGQIVIPRNLTSGVLQMMNDDLDHFGTAKTAKGSKRNSSGGLCHWKLRTGAQNFYRGSYKDSATSTNCRLPPRRTGDVGYCRIYS